MNILPSIYRESAHFFEQSFLPAIRARDKRVYAIALLALSCFVALACAYYYCCIKVKKKEPENSKTKEEVSLIEVKKPEEPVEIPEVTEEAKLGYQQGIKTFSFDVLNQRIAESEKDNQLISPLGISFLLSMIKHGVGIEDQAEIERIAHLPHDHKDLKVSAYELIKKLLNNGLNIAGLLYIKDQYRLNPVYQSDASRFYQSLVANGSSAKQINKCVEEITAGQIKEVITQDDLADFFVLLVNAIHFKGRWEKEFKAVNTNDDKFYDTPGEMRTVKMMTKMDNLQYFENGDCQAIKLRYLDNSEFSLLLVLPGKHNDFSFIDESDFNLISQGMESQRVDVTLPKFKLEQEIDLKEMLTKMGMNRLFGRPDFSPLVDLMHEPSKASLSELFISKMTQKSALECDEEGTEASSVTLAMVKKELAMRPEPPDKKILFNRPFLAALLMEDIPVMFGVVRRP
jgi:serpin B